MLWKLVVVGLGLVAGDVLMKKWSISGETFRDLSVVFYILGVAVYGASFTLYAYQLRTVNFGIATIVPILINIIVVALISFFYYKEALSIYQGIGIFLAIFAVILFSK